MVRTRLIIDEVGGRSRCELRAAEMTLESKLVSDTEGEMILQMAWANLPKAERLAKKRAYDHG